MSWKFLLTVEEDGEISVFDYRMEIPTGQVLENVVQAAADEHPHADIQIWVASDITVTTRIETVRALLKYPSVSNGKTKTKAK